MVTAAGSATCRSARESLAPIQALEAPVREAQAQELTGRPVPSVAELVEADAQALWSDDDLREEA